MQRRLSDGALVLALVLLFLAGCAQAQPGQPLGVSASALPRAKASHVVVIVMENAESSDVLGNGAAPYTNSLARRYGLATQSYAVTHPSLPNYLALTSGSTQGISSDCTGCHVSAPNIVDQLEAARISWKAYLEDAPNPCFRGAEAGGYAKKHNPFAYYTSVTGSPSRCRQIVPLTRLRVDELANRLPRFVWVTPNLCHDMHDCDVSVGDRFLARSVPPLLKALGPRGILFLIWDEGSSDNGCCRLASGGHVVGIVAGGQAAHGARLLKPVDHYSVLQTIEDLLGLPRLRGAACSCTPSLTALVRGTARQLRRQQ